MMRFVRQKEPSGFDARCRKPGERWLAKRPDYDRPQDYWSPFEPQLRNAFRGLCAYCVMYIPRGQTDHFIPVAVLKKKRRDKLAYEWKNLRYIEGVLNSRKSKHIVLDPFKVEDDWFEIQLPSMQLLLTNNVPANKRKRAALTLEKLGLKDDEVVVRVRREWFKIYQERKLTLEGLGERAPLIARAVEADLQKGIDWRNGEKAT